MTLSPKTSPKKRVLVVDDDDSIRVLLRTVFEQAGYSVVEAHDGEEGLYAALNQNPEVIILDVMMPSVDGYSMCQSLKQSAMTRHIPVIFLTVRDKVKDRLEGFQLGADDYVSKPFSPIELVARTESVMNRASYLLNEATHLPRREKLDEEIIKILDLSKAFSIFAFRLHLKSKKLFSEQEVEEMEKAIGLVAGVLLKVLSREGFQSDFIGHYDSDTFIILTLNGDPYKLFDEIISVWNKVSSIQQKQLTLLKPLQLNSVHLRIENYKQNLDNIFKRMNGLFEYGASNGSFISGATL